MNKYKTLALNTAVFAIGSFGSKILAFLLNRLYTANMDAAVYNTKEILELCANFLIPIVSFSITDAVIRYGLDKNYEKQNVFSNAVTVLLFGAAGFLLLSPLLLLYTDIRPYVWLLVGYVCISCFRQISTQFARARGMVRLFALDGIFCTLTMFLFNLLLIGWLDLGVTGFLLSVMLSDFCSGLSVWLIAKHGAFFSFRYVDKELLSVMLRFSLPLIPTALLWLITGFSDRLFIRYLMKPENFEIAGADAAGVYGAASKVPNLISMVSTIFFQAWNISAITENDSAERSAFYTKVYRAYQAVLFLAAGCIIALVKPLSAILIDTSKDPAYEAAYLYTPVLVISVLLMCFNQFMSSIYTVSKHTRNSFWTSIVAAAANVLLNAVLIPRYGIYGAIAATFVSYFLCYLVRLVDARRFIPFRISHLQFAANLMLLFWMCTVIIYTPPLPVLQLSIALAVMLVLNLGALLDTVKKILKR